jgi:hypothetical protein
MKIETIVDFFKSLFGIEDTVESIVSPITKIVDKLEKHEKKSLDEAQRHEEAARKAKEAALQKKIVANRAAGQRVKYSALVAE